MITPSQSSVTSGSRILDGVPPSPNDRIYPKKSPPGADTRSLLGSDPQDEGEGEDGMMAQPGNKLLLSVSMFMQGVNLAESVSPGFVPEPVKQWVAMAMEQAPQVALQMSQMGNPANLLAAVGQSGAAAGNPPMGMAAMSPMTAQAPMSGPPGGGRMI